ncbi:MAG: ribonuclease III [Chloroflexi bacterium]|nr:ribonuclease III [Chloroflexota bacterium]
MTDHPVDSRDLHDLEILLDLEFRDRALLERAFVHRSYLNEHVGEPIDSNERLEFLGDAVLGYVAAEYLYLAYPDLSEGQLTELRARLVCRESLASWARRLELGDYLRVGRGEELSGGRGRPALLAATAESLVGAVALDAGVARARDFSLTFLEPEAAAVLADQRTRDHKSRLQERAQAERGHTPVYRVVSVTGPDHARTFEVAVSVGDETLANGTGISKQAAEQEAARSALAAWPEPKPTDQTEETTDGAPRPKDALSTAASSENEAE